MQYQLRRFRIVPGRMAEFVRLWETGVAPLRRQAGFEIQGAWTLGDDEFVWVLGYDGQFESADRAYYESAARQDLYPDPALLIESSDEQMVRRVV